MAAGSPVPKAATITSKTVPTFAPKIYGNMWCFESIMPVAARGMSMETITDVLGTRIVNVKPAKKDREGLPNVDVMRPLDTSVEKVADIYFSVSRNETINSAQPTRNPIQAGINRNTTSTHGLMRLNIDGMADMPGT